MIIISLKAARVNANLTLIEASNQLNINKDTLCRLERDSTDIPISLVHKMVALYKIPMENLYFGKISEFNKTR
ncbi:helix-turn-helix transcriptional regulator [Granulicatella sp. zg-84]|uniref:helix-turn-helix domain-containing protein n=1 Tax=Granulicatella sp. zg-84 TaxID=2678503 RepID=UPI0019681BB9|nr:helix-turn-helix transcriptional regulator [Granulicatella sp. zg-84]